MPRATPPDLQIFKDLRTITHIQLAAVNVAILGFWVR